MGLLDGTPRLVDRTLTAQVGSTEHRAWPGAPWPRRGVLKNEAARCRCPRTSPGISLGGKTADNIGNQCGGWTSTWQGMSGAVTPADHGAPGRRGHRPGRVAYALDGSATGNGATVGIAVIGETPYSEGCGDIPTPSVALLREPTDDAVAGRRRVQVVQR